MVIHDPSDGLDELVSVEQTIEGGQATWLSVRGGSARAPAGEEEAGDEGEAREGDHHPERGAVRGDEREAHSGSDPLDRDGDQGRAEGSADVVEHPGDDRRGGDLGLRDVEVRHAHRRDVHP